MPATSTDDAAAPSAEEALASEWLESTSAVVWDFDLTILAIHAFGDGVEPHEVPGRWEREVRDVALLRAFVTVAQRKGIPFGIASYGRSEVILAYMSAIFAGAEAPPFTHDNVVTPAALGLIDGTSVTDGKPKMLALLCERATPPIAEPDAVLFFDDDGENIAGCRRAGFGNAHHTPLGFSRVMLARLEGARSKRGAAAAT